MPIYEYRCASCDHLAEVIHGINDPGPRFCESCGAEGSMRKGIGSPTVLFKGSGWARKDRPARRSSGSGDSEATSGERDGKKAGEAGSSEPGGGEKAAPSPATSGTDD